MVRIITDGIRKEGLQVWGRLPAAQDSPLVELRTRHTLFRSDEPEEFGSGNRGPMPVELFLGSYLASLGMLTRVAAKESDLELEAVELGARAQIDPRGMYGLAQVEQTFQEVEVEVTLLVEREQSLPQELPGLVLQRCPIHALLKGAGIPVRDRWRMQVVHGKEA